MSFFGSSTNTSSSNLDLNKDIQVSDGPSDTVSDLSFSPVAEFLGVTSWDNSVRIYEIQPNGQTIGKAMYNHDAPVLCCGWSRDGTQFASGGVDKTVKLFDVQTGQQATINAHDNGVKCLRFVDVGPGAGNIMATGSWDKTLKYWDLRQPNPISVVQLPERCYVMDCKEKLMVIGTAERHICIINMNNPTTIYKSSMSPLKFQTRSLACFTSANGYAVGSVEGRCSIQYVEEKDSNNNFSFRCHRENTGISGKDDNVFSINAISFHPVHGTFSTAGSDGSFHYWDKDSRHRLKVSPNVGAPITATAFSRSGEIFAYAVGYDWSKGHAANDAKLPKKVMLHAVGPDDMKSKIKKK